MSNHSRIVTRGTPIAITTNSKTRAEERENTITMRETISITWESKIICKFKFEL